MMLERPASAPAWSVALSIWESMVGGMWWTREDACAISRRPCRPGGCVEGEGCQVLHYMVTACGYAACGSPRESVKERPLLFMRFPLRHNRDAIMS
jgi:hypothetical protein